MKEERKNKKDEECPLCRVSEETLKKLQEKTSQTKREKYLLKKQQKERERLLKARRKKVKKAVFVYVPILLIIAGLSFALINYLSREKEEKHLGTPKIEVSPQEYDAGTISLTDGLLKHTFEIKNKGVGDLKIDRIWTSCMCTTARLRVGENESEEFGMHSNPMFWSQKITPDQTGFLEVSFDPAFHGSEVTGSVIRAVYLSTNDPQNEKVEVKLIANVIE